MTRVLVVGAGMVGARVADDLLAADSAGRLDITVLGAEATTPYNRVLLSDVVAGRYAASEIGLPPLPHDRLAVHEGVAVTSVDRADRSVTTADGRRLRYDFLVLATGARARVPDLPGLRGGEGGMLPAGVHPLRTLGDATAVVAASRTARHAVVLGGGVLGLEVATGLRRRGLAVVVVHPGAGLMDRQLGSQAADVLARSLHDLGVGHRLGRGATEVVTTAGADGRRAVEGVRLSDGEVVPADLLVVTAGTVPDTDLARGAGLAVGRGVLVDEHSRTADPRVFAVGDCAEPPEGGTGLVAQGWAQSARLAELLTSGTRPPAPAPTPAGDDVVRVKAHGVDVVTMGVSGGADARTVALSDPAAGRHVEVSVVGDRLVGATCIGSPDVAADLVVAYTRRTPLPTDPARLLLTAPAGEPVARVPVTELPDEGVVCRCSSVTKGAIRAAVADGAHDVAEVAARTRASTGCGSCRADVCALLAALTPADAPA
ncbi:FAD-dependent oxidoreductase [Janibacter sp. Y6]|uniref:FAD-dependent oxidoreductase n=1 Tax=Janibacter sp. Y6 TaxID=2913552 RepID=UPI0034A0E0EA